MADIKISELGAASAVNGTDIFPMTSSGVTVKATAQQIKNYISDACEMLVIDISSFSSLPKTITNTSVENDMVVAKSILSNPTAQTGDWSVTTYDGSLTISGTISGSTSLTLYLQKSR